MKFYGKGGVWDKDKGKMLCRFVDGELVTEEKRVIEILKGLGYKSDPIKPETKRKRAVKK